MQRIIFGLFTSSVLVTSFAFAAPVKVTTDTGVLVGEQSISTEYGAINSFKGVPYAQAPVGELRWQPPQPMQWQGEREAKNFALPCLQATSADGRPNGAGVSGESSEDCLYLNVWAPADAKKAPVMLWIYGGGGTMGSGSVATYHGEGFARDGIILVTINYRLGVLAGFAHPVLTQAALAEVESSNGESRGQSFGNYHLLDVMAALRWVKNNAAAFGGDPNNVIVFGESAGATITANLVTSPMAKGLLDKAIIESTGSLPAPATTLAVAEEQGTKAMIALGLGEAPTLAAMRAISAEDIIANREARGGVRTILDGQIKTQSILDSFASGNEIDVPMIIGTNSDEGRLRGTQLVATYAQKGEPVWQYFFDYVPDWQRAERPNGAPHAAEIPYVFDTVTADRRGGDRMTAKDIAVAKRIHSCWVAFAKAPKNTHELNCADNFTWPARSDNNNKAVAIFQETPSLGHADDLKSPPNGAEPGPTSRP